MADFAAHYIFGQMLLEREKTLPAKLAAHEHCYNWGLIGPDILFAHRFLSGGSYLKGLGSRMHDEKTARLFAAMADYINTQQGDERACTAAYFYGFIGHYCFDAEIHPYVYAIEAQRSATDSSRSNNVHHFMIESDIDMDMYTWYRGEPVSHFRPGRLFSLSNAEKLAIARLYVYVLRTVYGTPAAVRDICDSIADSLALHMPQYAPAKLVAPLTRLLDKLSGKRDALSSFIKDKNPAWDSLNLAHAQWRAPDGTLRSLSVPDIAENGLGKAQELIGGYAAMFASGQTRPVVYSLNFEGSRGY